MRSHFIPNRSAAIACAVSGAAALLSESSPAQSFVAADYATNSIYASGWQAGQNGGFGFTPWNTNGTGGSAVQQRIDNSTPFNHLGQAWTLFNPNGRPSGTDLAEAGRGFSPLQVGQTISTVFENPTDRYFYRGYTIRLVSGGQNVTYGGSAVERFALYMFDYFTPGRWYSPHGPYDSPHGGTSLFDTNTYPAGAKLDITLTGPQNYQFTLTPLDNPGLAYTESGTLKNSGPIDWIQFEFYNGASDPTNKPTDFFISSLTISDVHPIPPTIVSQPVSRILYPGRTARFKASATGTPLQFQWRKNGVNLPNGGNVSGAQSDTLVIGNVGPGDVASYTLVVTNTAGSGAVTSSPPATLTLAQPSGTAYENAVLAANPIAHWRLNETGNPATNPPAYDFAGGLAGYYEQAALNGFNSIAGPKPPDWPGFESNNRAMESTANTVLSWVTVPALYLQTNSATFTLWLNPNGSQFSTPGLFFTRQGSTSAAGIGYSVNDQIGYNWNNDPATYQFQSGLIVPFNQWSFVALVVEPSQATVYLYNTNGLSSAVNPVTHQNVAWDGTARIGSDENNLSRTFDGLIDEVAVFNYALTPAQVLAIYNAALSVTLNIQKVGPNLQLTWPSGTLLEANDLAGPWSTNSATPPYTFTPSAAKKFYRVQVQ
jgi:hypothetical protein